jgi:hypothetical protein
MLRPSHQHQKSGKLSGDDHNPYNRQPTTTTVPTATKPGAEQNLRKLVTGTYSTSAAPQETAPEYNEDRRGVFSQPAAGLGCHRFTSPPTTLRGRLSRTPNSERAVAEQERRLGLNISRPPWVPPDHAMVFRRGNAGGPDRTPRLIQCATNAEGGRRRRSL